MQSGAQMGHTCRSQHLPSRLASVIYWGAGRAAIRDEYPCGRGLVAAGGRADRNDEMVDRFLPALSG
jgi:hypothetical protein